VVAALGLGGRRSGVPACGSPLSRSWFPTRPAPAAGTLEREVRRAARHRVRSHVHVR
jgi:hypothetical protein